RDKGIDCTIGLNYFLPIQRNKIPKNDRSPLNKRYLKKGNKFIFVSANVDFEDISYLGVFENAKFVTNNLRMQHRLFGRGVFGNSHSNGIFELYTASWEWFLPVADNFYFTPLFGIGPMVNIYGNIKDIDLGWAGTAQVGFTQ